MRLLVRQILMGALIIGAVSCKKDKKLHFNEVVKLNSHTSSRLNKVQFIGNGIYIAAGGEKFSSAEISRSTDGGDTWEKVSFPEAGKGLYGMCLSPRLKIYMTGIDAKLLVSADGGQNWSFTQLSNWKYNVGVAYTPGNMGYYISTEAQMAGYITRIDSNNNILDTKQFNFGLNDICMVNDQTGYVSGYGAILKTVDGGTTWSLLDIQNDNFMALDCKSADELWVCGNAGSILHSTDGGKTWDRLRNGNSLTLKKYNLNDIYFTDADHGWAVGDDGVVIATDDAGKNWKEYNKFTTDALRCISLMLDGNLIVCGDNGALYKLVR